MRTVQANRTYETDLITYQLPWCSTDGNTTQRKTRKVISRAGKNVQRGVEDAPPKTDIE